MNIDTQQRLILPMKLVTIVCCILLFVVIKTPMWKIELTAPQYPEGLVLKIWPDKIAGDVEIINGLNHYIGMRKMHTDDFIEFKVLPIILYSLLAAGILVLILNRRKYFNLWFYLFILVSVVSMVDFYRWEYDYGHELNPDAPIKVPGMAYQPPLIGYKKLLNFGAYSIPDTGGWIFASIGVALAITWFIYRKPEKKFKMKA